MDKSTAIRLTLFALAWLNSILAARGFQVLPVFSETEVADFMTLLISLWTMWKNNDITKDARNKQDFIEMYYGFDDYEDTYKEKDSF